MTKLHRLAELGQAVWLDYIRRSFIASGDLQALIDDGLRGITSNPSILRDAITGSSDYDDDLRRLVEEGHTALEIYEALALDDIRWAADLLRPVYQRTGGLDGYVSLEVNPTLAYDTNATIEEARRLFAALDRPNVMIKVPATEAGIPAIEALIGAGVNVNITLMFSLDHYDAVAEAYLSGLETLAQAGGDLSGVASVASFFVSRVDTAVDAALDEIGTPEAAALRGQIAMANAKAAYARLQAVLASERWKDLAARGARAQRVLWASTSTKDPRYSDTRYVDNLIGPHTVNTVPPDTLRAFRDHGTIALTVTEGLAKARAQLETVAHMGVDLRSITAQLQRDGVDAFADSFQSLLAGITEKRRQLLADWTTYTASLGSHQEAVDQALAEMDAQQIPSRMWAHDHTVWQPQPDEIVDRLGWLHVPQLMRQNVDRLAAFSESVRSDGLTEALLMGMGGSSLAPELFGIVFAEEEGLKLEIVDSTHPQTVLARAERHDPARTLYIVATKSGTTVETLSFFKYLYNRALDAVGQEEVGQHFVAVTDPGSRLVDLAERYRFRQTFLNDPQIGGRYAALSYFGLLPAALAGVDLSLLLDRASAAVSACEPCVAAAENPGLWLGAALGELARAGRDKLTLVASEAVAPFADWVEQLVAESTGKSGTGILPVVGEPLGRPEQYGPDRLFVQLRLAGDGDHDAALAALETAGHPVVRLHLRDRYDLGRLFFLWELAVAVAGHRMGIHPFNQPNVESAKAQARHMVQRYQEEGALPAIDAAPPKAEVLDAFLAQAERVGGAPSPAAERSYVALQAYLPPTGEIDRLLADLRLRLWRRTGLATTVGYGPRYLHSTGQLHKGDSGDGLFIQLIADPGPEVPIPDQAGAAASSISFGVLHRAQALGDRRALEEADRRVITFDLGTEFVAGLERLGKR